MSNIIPGGQKGNPLRNQKREQLQMQNVQEVRQAFANHVGSNETDFEDVVCACSSRHYDQCIRKKRISGLHPSNPFQTKEQFVDIITYVCHGCAKELKLAGPHKNVTFEKTVEVIQ